MPNSVKIAIGIMIAIIAVYVVYEVGWGFSTLLIYFVAAFVYVVLTELLEVLVYIG